MVNNAFSRVSSDNDSTVENLVRRFLRAGMELHRFGKAAGYRIIPTNDPKLTFFRLLPYEKQLSVVTVLETFVEIYSTLVRNRESLRNMTSVIWATLRALGLVPPGDLFDKISDEDVVEVYSRDGLQLFANFKFFDLCSYTIEQIYCIPWQELWRRDEASLKEMMQIQAQALGIDQIETAMFSLAPHQITEISSPFQSVLNYQLKGTAPLWDKRSHQKTAFMVIEQAEVLVKISTEQEEQLLQEFYQKIEPLEFL